MGDGSHLPGTLMRATLPLLALLAGCIDFVEPDLAELGAPAVIEASIRLSDLGDAEFDALLAPGLDRSGLRRVVIEDASIVLGRPIASDSVAHNGSRRYRDEWVASVAAVGEPVTFRAPGLADLEASAPEVTWRGVRRVGPDTVDVSRGADLVLEIGPGTGGSLPEPEVQQWFLRLEGDDGAFNISADGPPPNSIHVPARWIPDGDRVAARLIFMQSAVIENAPGDYVGLITLDIRLHWTVRLLDPPPGARR